jgi:ATP-dependent protease ClpP protease subunit
MAKVITLSGAVGFGITAEEVRAELKAAKGGPVEFHVNSPGGFVFEGIEIFNLIREYKGHTEARITALAASAASYFVLAADKVSAFDNATFMIHNALALTIGNHNDMRKVANTLESLSNILAKAYVAKTGKSMEEIKALMDDDSYFFGDEILDEGFIDEIIESPETEEGESDKEAAVMEARASIETCRNEMRDTDAANADLDRAVAYVDTMSLLLEEHQASADINAQKVIAPAVVGNSATGANASINTPAGAGKKKQEDKHMTLAELLAAAYDKPTKELGVAVITGEKSVEAFDAVVAVVDRENEKAAQAAAQGEEGQGGEETPPSGGDESVAAAANYEARKARLNAGEV